MNRTRTAAAVLGLSLLLALCDVPVQAKRSWRAPVASVVLGKVRYFAPSDPAMMGFVLATDAATGRELWQQRVYHVTIYPFVAECSQQVFILALGAREGCLLIYDERGRCFALDPTTKRVRRVRLHASHA